MSIRRSPASRLLKKVAALLAAMGALSLPLAANGQTPAAAGPPSAAPASAPQISAADRTYILGPADVLEVDVLGREDYRTRARISEEGTIQLPYLGSVVASNKTTAQLADEIAAALEKGGFFAHPIMSIEIVSYASRYVTVLGEVGAPGLIPVDRPYHLSEILARVGGVKDDGADYVVLRSDTGAPRQLSISALATGDPKLDPFVSPGDKIFAPKAEIFYISGQVKAPGAYAVVPGMTVRMAIARGGGLTDEGSEGKVKVSRPGQRSESGNLEAKVQAGDVIVVGERLF